MVDGIFDYGYLKFVNFSKKEENIINLVLRQFEEMCEFKHIDEFLIYKAKFFYKIRLSADTFAFVQPLIDEKYIIGHRIYINRDYDYTTKELKQIVMHELIHTLAEKEILKHGTIKFNDLCKTCKRLYGYDPKRIVKSIKE